MTKLKRLQKAEFKILKRIDTFCSKHNINYFLYSGTLLGAIRHQGFIPWDDDIDIAMRRLDFNKFDNLLAAGTFDEEDFYYQSNRLQPFYLTEVVKIRTNTINVMEKVSTTQTGFSGPWVDIFPLDNIPDDFDLRIQQYNQLKRLNKIINFFLRTKEKENDKGINRWFKKTVREFNEKHYKQYFFLKYLFDKRYKIMTKYNDVETMAVGSLAYMSFKNYKAYESCFINKEHLQEYTRLPFKSKQFLVPKEYHKILTNQYGDYMEKPKITMRVAHKLIFAK